MVVGFWTFLSNFVVKRNNRDYYLGFLYVNVQGYPTMNLGVLIRSISRKT